MRWAIEFFEKMAQTVALLPNRLQHVVPNAVGTDRMALLTQVHTIDCHDREVWFDVVPIEHACVLEERLVDHSEVIGVEFRHEADSLHDLHKSPLKLPEVLTVCREFLAENARAFDGPRQVAGERRADLIH